MDNDETQLSDNVGEESNEAPASPALGNATVQQSEVDSEAKTVLNFGVEAQGDTGLGKTVVEPLINQPVSSNQQVPADNSEEGSATRPELRFPDECPQCHYPLRPNTQRCPNCQAVIWPIGSENNEPIIPPTYAPPADSAPVGSTVMVNPHDVKPKAADNEICGTVNPFMQPKAQPKPEFSLELIAGQGEVLSEKEHNYEGDEVVLNRSNTEATNNTITSKVQAVVKFDGEHWTIEDRSTLMTTYVRAGRPIEINDGDIILLGDRQFIFHVDKDK
ncbi:MAG: hypothetical protein ACI4AM_01865 [Muribaculaceae bacterium]